MNRPLPTRLASAAAAAAAVLALGACTPATSTEGAAAFHACLDAPSLQFASIATTADALSCGPDEIPVSWLAAAPLDSTVPTFAATASTSTGSNGQKGAAGVDGEDGETGAAGPAGSTGAAGPAGSTGAAGIPGSDGNGIHNGSGIPESSVGIDGDFYLNTTAFTVHGPKSGGAWPSGTQSLIGPQGPIGPQGIQGLPGIQGTIGAAGPQGPFGPTGAVGPTGATGPAGPQGPAGAPAASVLIGSVSFVDAADTSGFIPLSGGSEVVFGISDAEIDMPRGGIISKLSVAVTPRNGTVTLSLWVDGQGVPNQSCTVEAGQKTCVVVTGWYGFSAGADVALGYTATGTEPVRNLRYSMGFEGS